MQIVMTEDIDPHFFSYLVPLEDFWLLLLGN